MVIEEFISTYAEQELNKINKMNQKNQYGTDDGSGDGDEKDVESLDLTPASRGGSSKIKYIFNYLIQGEQ